MSQFALFTSPYRTTAAKCALIASGTVAAWPEEIPALRQRPHPGERFSLPANLLKHADDQTVAGLAAVFRAMEGVPAHEATFHDWAVVAAPRFLGRVATVAALEKFALEGAWGVSPHLIPNRSLHSLSGTISLALGLHGPNFGVGGGPTSASEALLAAVALLQDSAVPGVWLVMTGWHPELAVAPGGRPASRSLCQAVVLALTPSTPQGRQTELRLTIGGRASGGNGHASAATPPLFSLTSLADVLTSGAFSSAPPVWTLDCGGWVQLELDRAADAEARAGLKPATNGQVAEESVR